jgi:hypothetical protein
MEGSHNLYSIRGKGPLAFGLVARSTPFLEEGGVSVLLASSVESGARRIASRVGS